MAGYRSTDSSSAAAGLAPGRYSVWHGTGDDAASSRPVDLAATHERIGERFDRPPGYRRLHLGE